MRCRQTQTRVCVLQDLPIAKKIRDGIGELGEKRLLPITKRRQFDRGTLRPSTYTQRSVAGALRLKFFIFLSVVPRGVISHQQNRKPPIRWFIQKKKKKKEKEKQEAEVKPHFQGRCRIA